MSLPAGATTRCVIDLGRVAIVGAGAVGSYYGGRLAHSGQDVSFLLRSNYQQVKREGLSVESCAGNFHLPEVAAYRDSQEIGPVDWVIVAAKATANESLVEVVRPLLGPDTAILTLQNGLGNDVFFAEHFGVERVLGGLCFVCINRLPDGLIRHTASGLIRIGEHERGITPRLRRVVEAFEAAGVPCEAVASLEKAQWMKLVWNFPFNGLAVAEGGVDTGVLLNERQLEPEVRALMGEVMACARALGHEIPDSFIDQQVDVTYGMKAYRPSSMIDFVAGRPVEFEAIWNLPVNQALELGVEVPRMLELRERVWQALAGRDSGAAGA